MIIVCILVYIIYYIGFVSAIAPTIATIVAITNVCTVTTITAINTADIRSINHVLRYLHSSCTIIMLYHMYRWLASRSRHFLLCRTRKSIVISCGQIVNTIGICVVVFIADIIIPTFTIIIFYCCCCCCYCCWYFWLWCYCHWLLWWHVKIWLLLLLYRL